METLSFREKVYNIVKRIPKGKVATYGQMAALCGNAKAARAVGLFLRTNPDIPTVPCHRVVASNGSLTGYSGAGGISKKRDMLRAEGVHFNKQKVVLAYSQWSP